MSVVALPLAETAYAEAEAMVEEGKYEDAVRAYDRALALGCPYSKLALANLLSGELDPPQYERAVELYVSAASEGNDTAAWNLAMHYRLMKNRDLYVRWLLTAMDMGHHDAAFMLKRFGTRIANELPGYIVG